MHRTGFSELKNPQHTYERMNNLITQKIKEYLQEYLASEKPQTSWTEPLTAFADARDPFFLHLKTAVSPTHALPSDLLPGAGSVVVYFLPFARDIAISNRAGRLASRQWARAYIETNRLIIELNKHLALLLKQEGVKTATQ